MAFLEELTSLYGRMSPQQRGTVAQQFAQQSGNNNAMDYNNVSPQQLAQLHQETEQRNPGLVQNVLKHPAVTAALAAVGTYELDKHYQNR